MSKKEKNHFVPKVYLKQWNINSKENFYCAELKNKTNKYSKFKEKNTGNAECYRNKLYWLDSDDPKYSISLENDFGKLETKFGEIMQKLNKGSVSCLGHQNYFLLIQFAYSLKTRPPGSINEQRSNNSELDVKANFLRYGYSLSEYEDTIKLGNKEDEIKNIGIRSVLECVTNVRNFTKYLKETFGLGSKLYILDTAQSKYKLLTSNYPIMIGKGLITQGNCDLILPLTPSKVLFLVNSESLNDFQDILKSNTISDFVININLMVLNNYKHNLSDTNYQIYSSTNSTTEIIPNNLITAYFY
ncbi:DUF4238 domain-containing protein [Facilibium subflavum]|uniref:DUF4238 domain-containing protein n=1 Tax=Facilibium subflavum TaxID=2219058 RepID=UPI000E658866|nr:DUF4238 domain-containing protein [Facilibium subflavum]